MKIKRIIPCLDVRDGKVVKGVKFDGVRDVGEPVESARKYAEQGADELVFYDITASIEKRIVDLNLVRDVSDVCRKAGINLTVAGGIGTIGDFERALNAGADKVSVNSLAIRNPEFIKEASERFGRENVVVGIDAKRDGEKGYKVMLGGGKVDSGLDLLEWVKTVEEYGAGEICLNSIDADGTKNGYDIEMLNAVCGVCGLPIIASGGAGKLEDFAEVFDKTEASGALAASIFHFGELTVKQVKKQLTVDG